MHAEPRTRRRSRDSTSKSVINGERSSRNATSRDRAAGVGPRSRALRMRQWQSDIVIEDRRRNRRGLSSRAAIALHDGERRRRTNRVFVTPRCWAASRPVAVVVGRRPSRPRRPTRQRRPRGKGCRLQAVVATVGFVGRRFVRRRGAACRRRPVGRDYRLQFGAPRRSASSGRRLRSRRGAACRRRPRGRRTVGLRRSPRRLASASRLDGRLPAGARDRFRRRRDGRLPLVAARLSAGDYLWTACARRCARPGGARTLPTAGPRRFGCCLSCC